MHVNSNKDKLRKNNLRTQSGGGSDHFPRTQTATFTPSKLKKNAMNQIFRKGSVILKTIAAVKLTETHMHIETAQVSLCLELVLLHLQPEFFGHIEPWVVESHQTWV